MFLYDVRIPRTIPRNNPLSVPPHKTAGIDRYRLLLFTAACLGAGPADHVKPLIGTDGHGHVFPGATASLRHDATVAGHPRRLRRRRLPGRLPRLPLLRHQDPGLLPQSPQRHGLSPTWATCCSCPPSATLKLTSATSPAKAIGPVFSRPGGGPPGYYRVFLPDSKINVELTATARAACTATPSREADDAHVILDLWHGIGQPPDCAHRSTIADDHTVTGFRRSDGWGGDKVFYFVIEFSRPFDGSGLASDHNPVDGKEATGPEPSSPFRLQDPGRRDDPGQRGARRR